MDARRTDDPVRISNIITPRDESCHDRIGLVAAANEYNAAITNFMFDDVRPLLRKPDILHLAQSCRFFHTLFQPCLDKTALLQAIIDDNRQRVIRILNEKPWLLLQNIKNDREIKSKLTWQKFKLAQHENPLAIAAKRKQIEMVNLLLPYYERLAEDDQLNEKSRQYAKNAKEAGLNAWSFYEIRKNARHKKEIVIPTEYTALINNLINLFTSEYISPDRKYFTQLPFTKLSEDIENAMRSLLNLLVPKTAVELDNHIDVELLLLAAYQLYRQKFHHFASGEQRDAFCIRVIGLIQSALSPETAKMYCEGFYGVVYHNRPIRDHAASLKLSDGHSFYRANRKSLSGLGGKYLCASKMPVPAPSSEDLYMFLTRIIARRRATYVAKHLSNKNSHLAALIQRSQSRPEHTSPGCVMS